jgi:UDP-4-amino-4,6-dideoxy-N-acetyl-beta-L-altrosamine transaminase
MSSSFLPYGRQSIDESDIEAVCEVLRGDWLTTGPAVSDFERAFELAVGAKHAVGCSNGTAALHLALAGLDIGPGDVCIVPAVTFMATANAALYCGAEVVFADVDPETGLMTPELLKQAISSSDGPIKAVLPVHLAGQIGDMPALRDIASREGALVVEDACHAVGSQARNSLAGDCRDSDAAVFSFHPVKTIAAGEGGMVTTNDPMLADRMRRLRSHGIERAADMLERGADEPWWHEMQALGWNYRLSDIQAALAHSQLKRLPRFKARRRELAQFYDAALSGASPHIEPLKRVSQCDPCLHLYPVRIDFDSAGVDRVRVMERLREASIGTQVHYIPVPDQPYYRQRYGSKCLPGASAYYGHTLSLPLFYGMSDSDPARVVAALLSALEA